MIRWLILTTWVIATLAPAFSAETVSVEKLEIIDAHGHLNADMPAERLIELMDQAGVQRMVLMPRYYASAKASGHGSDRQALDYAKRFPGRFIPFIAGQREELTSRRVWEAKNRVADAFLQQAEAELKDGDFFGLGEFIIRHYAYSNFGKQGGGDVDVPIDGYLMHQIARLAAKYHVPVSFHAEAEPEVAAAVTRLLESESGTTFIWAHNCGRSSADAIRTLLTRYPNLVCDLAAMAAPGKTGYGTYWPKRTPWIHLIEDGRGNLYPEMARLFDDFPDRFMIGTDAAHTPALNNYLSRIARFRKLLSQLKPETARKLAYENAEQLFGSRR